ncbi:hypothetical protein JTB14_031948 [Gonioctena quinquepunctata]|nr:hypothetical protein JTB14_031948 [Gonioctena quinquepunctata]
MRIEHCCSQLLDASSCSFIHIHAYRLSAFRNPHALFGVALCFDVLLDVTSSLEIKFLFVYPPIIPCKCFQVFVESLSIRVDYIGNLPALSNTLHRFLLSDSVKCKPKPSEGTICLSEML